MINTYKLFLAVPITVIVVVIFVIGVPAVKLFVDVPDYDLYVDAIINKRSSPPIGQVLIQNIGSQPLTNVKVDYGEGDILDLGTLDAKHKMILTPPFNNNMEFVIVTADQNVFVNITYSDKQLTK